MTKFKDTTGAAHEIVNGNFVEAPDGIAIEAADGRTFYSRGSCRNDESAMALAKMMGAGRVHIRMLEPGEGEQLADDIPENPVVAWHRKNFPDVDLVPLTDDTLPF